MITCGGCDNTWNGLTRAHCAACHHTFNRPSLFDIHRVHGRCRIPAEFYLFHGIWRTPAAAERPTHWLRPA